MSLEPCMCEGWCLWYVDRDGPAIEVCWCGHPKEDHGEIVCLGWVERHAAFSAEVKWSKP